MVVRPILKHEKDFNLFKKYIKIFIIQEGNLIFRQDFKKILLLSKAFDDNTLFNNIIVIFNFHKAFKIFYFKENPTNIGIFKLSKDMYEC